MNDVPNGRFGGSVLLDTGPHGFERLDAIGTDQFRETRDLAFIGTARLAFAYGY